MKITIFYRSCLDSYNVYIVLEYYYFQEENVVNQLDESIQEAGHNNSTEFEFCLSEDNPIQSTSQKIHPSRPSKRSNDICDSLIDTIESHSKKPKSKDDRYDVLGKNVALKMRDIKDNTQKLLVEKIINEALFMAEMGQLSMTHSINNITLMHLTQLQHSNYESNNQITANHLTQTFNYANTPNHSTDDSSNQSLRSFISNYSDL